MCGATAVDRNFYALMYARFGQAFGDMPIQTRCPGSELMRIFENMNCTFDGSLNEADYTTFLPMAVPDRCDPLWYDRATGEIRLSRYDQPSGIYLKCNR